MTCSAFELFEAVETWTGALSEMVRSLYESTRQDMFERHREVTQTYLGHGTAELYNLVRKDLEIPFHRGLVDDPTYVLQEGETASLPAAQRKTIGSHISKVYEAITGGQAHAPVLAALKASLS
jgi:phenylalanine ammonia-lyase